MTDNCAAIWQAVDQITKPTRIRINREHNEWLTEQATTTALYCRIEQHTAATSNHGTIPSLWEQAEIALTTSNETNPGGHSPLAQRTPADLDLMEIMATIRETITLQLQGRNIHPKPGVPNQLRQLASHITGNGNTQHIEWWTYRIAQWSRLLAVYLKAIDTGPRPIRLRTPCPTCRTRNITIDTDQGPVVAAPILIDFVAGWIRAAQCQACGDTWWRGDDLNRLADQLETLDTTQTETA